MGGSIFEVDGGSQPGRPVMNAGPGSLPRSYSMPESLS
jgi:hypothetical protein